MSAYRLALFALSAAANLSAQYAYYLPHVSDGTATNGIIKTTLVVANVSATAANVKIAVTRDDSTVLPLTFAGLGTGNTFSVSLAAKATRLFATDGTGDGTSGAVVITADAPLKVSGIESNTSSSGEFLSESAVPAVAKEDLTVEYMAPVDTTGGFDTGIALYNPGTVAAQVTLRLLDGSGAPVSSTALPLRSNGRITFLGSQLAGAGSNFRGTVDVTSSVALAGVAVRRNASLPAYTLLPASDRIARGLHFFLPRVADGASESGTTQTTFLVTNLSTIPATVSLSLTRDDATPFDASIAGMGPDHTFRTTIAAGATIFWQTDGASEELTTGAAKIVANHPVGVAAVITSSDASGGLVSETGIAAAGQNLQFVIPFENTGDTAAAVTFLNTAGQDLNLTLDLLDPDGALLGSVRPAPIAGGARMAGKVSDFFPDAPGRGSIRASTGPLQPFLSVLALRQSASDKVISALPAFSIPWTATGTPTTVKPTLDPSRKATASVGPAGGTLNVTDAKGNRFTLTIPAQALVNHQTITMTAVASATGFSGPGFVAGVQLEPDGLALWKPALLKIEMAGPVPNGAWPLGWRGDQPGIYLNPPIPRSDSLTLALSHFSGAGVGGADLTTELVCIAGILELTSSVVAHYLEQSRQLQLLGMEEEASRRRADAVAMSETAYEMGLKPFLEFALRSLDTDVMFCALKHALEFEQTRQFAGLSLPDQPDPIGDEIRMFHSLIYDLRLAKLIERCQKHDLTVYSDLLVTGRVEVFVGGTTFPDTGALINTLQQCIPKLQLDYQSRMTVDQSAVSTLRAVKFDGTIQGSLVADGMFTKTELASITNPAQDLMTSFVLTGSGKERYDTPSIMMFAPCTSMVRNITTRPSTMTLGADMGGATSRVQYTFDPHYDPAALTQGGQQLCSFCPVFRKKVLKVELILDPGKPTESFEANCGGVSTPVPDAGLWSIGWRTFHSGSSGNGFIDGYILDWDIKDTPDLLAQKTISQARGISTERTDFKLKPCTGPADTATGTCTR